MQLTVSETIQVLRRRRHMNQGDFGAKAFETSYESGRTKIKNIELGKQMPTPEDLARMAKVLGVAPQALDPGNSGLPKAEGVFLPREVLEVIPGLETYLDMLVKAVKLGDRELMAYLAGKLGTLFNGQASRQA